MYAEAMEGRDFQRPVQLACEVELVDPQAVHRERAWVERRQRRGKGEGGSMAGRGEGWVGAGGDDLQTYFWCSGF